MTIEDQVIAVTGASAGIGAATARLVAAKGARVVLGARRQDTRWLSLPGTIGKVSSETAPPINGHPGVAIVLQKEGFVRVKQAAAMLGVSPNTVRAWGADGKVPEYRHPVNNYRLYKVADLKKILHQLEKSVSRFSKSERQSRVR